MQLGPWELSRLQQGAMLSLCSRPGGAACARMRPPPPHLGSIRADFKANGFKTRFCPPHRRSSAAGGLLAASVSGCSCHSRRLCPLPPAVPCPLSNKCEELKQLPCAVCSCVLLLCPAHPLGAGDRVAPIFPSKEPSSRGCSAKALLQQERCTKGASALHGGGDAYAAESSELRRPKSIQSG